uniref:Sulfotransferase domain-containing protein n=1 Tax=Oryza rufipogon TaxID=4529 RepID=A0A0E0QL67_ORYRU
MAQLGQLDAESNVVVAPTATGDEGADIVLASLPTREGWWTAFVLYHGCWMTPQAATSVSLVRAQFAPRPDDVLLATYPKCGTTWLKALSFDIANRSRHPVAGAGDHPLLTTHPQDLVPFIETPFRHLHPLSALDALPSPRLLSTHLPHQLLPPRVAELGCRIVYLCREPKDVVVSTWHFMNKVGNGFFLDLDEAFELFYDDMMADPAGHVKKLAEFLRVPFTDEEVGTGVVVEVVRLCSFEKLSRLPVNFSGVVDRIGGRPMENSSFFRKAKVGDWKNNLTQEMAQKLDAVIAEKLKGSAMAEGRQLEAQSVVVPTATGDKGDDILSSLPTREGWWTTFVLYHGCWMTPQTARSVSLVRAQFAPRDDDVVLATYPKCGTTWLKALAFAITNRSSHPVGAGDHPLLTQSPHDLVPFIELPFRHIHPLAAALDAIPSPRLLGTHMQHHLLPPRVDELGCRIVYLCREPKDVIVSLWHFINKVIDDDLSLDFDKAFEMFVDGFSSVGPIWNHYLGYWNKHVEEPDRVLFLKYDDMMADPTGHVKKLAKFLRVPFTDDEVDAGVVEEVVTLCSFEKLSRLPVNSSGVVDRIGGRLVHNSAFFRKGKVEEWKNYLTEEMAKKLDAVVEEKLKGSGLTF